MKWELLLAGLISGLLGCSSVQKTPEQPLTIKTEPPPAPFALMAPTAQYEQLANELKTVGLALQSYAKKHNGQFPPRLTTLVRESYLPAGALISSADPTGGKEGGVPDAYREWGQAAEADEAGSSYLYEFSEAPCKWDWKSYLGDHPAPQAVDMNQDGTVSWAELKTWQLHHGDVVQKAGNKPYPVNRFPVVRCYWYRYPDAYTHAEERTILNLSVDLQTVFVSRPWWEKDL